MTQNPDRNRLAEETSPYLLQHKDNPVHWRAWGADALAEAKEAGKPILLSVGYAACHWCHVMAHESFEDEATAALMNEYFVSIKVDREERPDIDAIYMTALHRMGEHGGWPLTMFLDGEGRPFWGGTYFPPESRWGKPDFKHVLREIARIYREEPDKVRQNAEELTNLLRPAPGPETRGQVGDTLLADLANRLAGIVDSRWGGIEGAPKFPQWSFFWLLWRGAIRYGNAQARAAAERTLTHISQGGIYDHLGGGFARYSVDERWLVPHFEKMLYDNALLIDLMTEVYRETQNPLLARRVTETVGWLSREMIAEGGGFASSLDADSEGEEGKFYVWGRDEIRNVLGEEDAEFFFRIYDVTAHGNFEGHNILNRLGSVALLSEDKEARLAGLRAKLLDVRAGRVRPGWDDKVLADWNGLMIAALARASRVFGEPGWLVLARTAFAFVETKMTKDGRLIHSYRAGRGSAPATASDYANMIWAAIRLHEATAEDRYLDRARGWAEILDHHYWDATSGGYFLAADDTADVLVRLKSAQDDATPNTNAVMTSNLVQLFLLTGDTGYFERAQRIPQTFAEDINRSLVGHTGLLAAGMDLLAPQHVVIIGEKAGAAGALAAALNSISVPGSLEQIVPAGKTPAGNPALAGKTAVGGKPTAYVCIGPQCSPPVTDPAQLKDTLERMRRASSPA